MRLTLPAAALAVLTFSTVPALAHDHGGDDDRQAAYPGGPYPGEYEQREQWRDQRENWLADCRQRLSARDSGVGGAVIGGVVGGVAGNRIAGRGNRTVGTLAGAAVGAAAGVALDKAEDRGRNRDQCEAYLDDYYAHYQQGGYPGGPGYQPQYGYPQQGYVPQGDPGYGYPVMAVPMMMVPVAQPQPPHCTETVEYVYEDVPVRPARRVIPRRAKIVTDKRVKLVPDKRVPVK
jgi:hypothetical protein